MGWGGGKNRYRDLKWDSVCRRILKRSPCPFCFQAGRACLLSFPALPPAPLLLLTLHDWRQNYSGRLSEGVEFESSADYKSFMLLGSDLPC